MEDKEEHVRDELSSNLMRITKGDSFMFDNIDSFVTLSKENTSIWMVTLSPFDRNAGNYEVWEKVGEIVGNLTELKILSIEFQPCYQYHREDDDGDEACLPDWEILTRILRYLPCKISLISGNDDAEVEDIQGLARAIHGHPMMLGFSCQADFTFENLGPWCSALSTLPSLKSAKLGLQEPETEDQRVLASNLEPLKELLRTPALRFVRFDGFYFTNELCHAIANALEEGSSIIDIGFDSDCSFPHGGKAIIANALKTNVTVTDLKFLGNCDEPLCNALAAVLLSNSTLQNLTLQPLEGAIGRWLVSIFLSLAVNTSLKTLSVSLIDVFGDELCAAIRNDAERR
jgi:hypothetical protein